MLLISSSVLITGEAAASAPRDPTRPRPYCGIESPWQQVMATTRLTGASSINPTVFTPRKTVQTMLASATIPAATTTKMVGILGLVRQQASLATSANAKLATQAIPTFWTVAPPTKVRFHISLSFIIHPRDQINIDRLGKSTGALLWVLNKLSI